MTGIIPNIKDILTIKIKVRHDGYTDQYSRIFMVKILLVGTLLIGLNWYHDKITCMVPNSIKVPKEYISDTCWIQGFYVYEEVRAERDTVAYEGIPTNLDHDGRYENGKYCVADSPRKYIKDKDCKPLRKLFYVQYQYMPFFVAVLAIMYYLPHIGFMIVNSDMVALKSNLKLTDADKIIQNFFDPIQNRTPRMKVKVVGNLTIKLVYVIVNMTTFLLTDRVLNGKYLEFGIEWMKWAGLSNHMAYDYMGERGTPKPGQHLLPTFGICELHEGTRNIRETVTDKHKFICEYSQHILFHYVLLVFWFLFVIGIIISTTGFIMKISVYFKIFTCFGRQERGMGELSEYFTVRECEYLAYIRGKNLIMYATILEKIRNRNGMDGKTATRNDYRPGFV